MIEKDIFHNVQLTIGPKRLAEFEVFDLTDKLQRMSDLQGLFRKHSVSDRLNQLFDDVIRTHVKNPEFTGKVNIKPASFTNNNDDGTVALYNAWSITFSNTEEVLIAEVLICLHESNRIIIGIVDCTIENGDALIRTMNTSHMLN